MKTCVFFAICFLTMMGSFVVPRSAATATEQPELRRVSIVALIASPRQHSGRRVYVTGYLALSREAEALYLHEEDFRYGMTDNAIKLVLDTAQRKQFKAFSRKYVIVEGTFDDAESDMFTGHMIDITRMQRLETEEEFLRRQRTSAKP